MKQITLELSPEFNYGQDRILHVSLNLESDFGTKVTIVLGFEFIKDPCKFDQLHYPAYEITNNPTKTFSFRVQGMVHFFSISVFVYGAIFY